MNLRLNTMLLAVLLLTANIGIAEEPLAKLWREPAGKRMRVSSWNPTGRNGDNKTIEPGETLTVADVAGSGKVTRIWMTYKSTTDDHLQKIRYSFTFDGQKTIERVPVGMLFATGPWRVNDVVTPVVNVMRSHQGGREQQGVGHGSFNLHWEMPFAEGFKIEITNETDQPVKQFYYIDYEELEHDTPPLLLHADYNRRMTKPQPGDATKNVERNYQIANIQGYRGNFVGTVLCVESHPDRAGKWYEGDDMFVIDDEPWPPRLHGTGTEDYFGMAWGIHRPYQAHDHGVSHFEKPITDHDRFFDGRFVVYRWHLGDPIGFTKSLRATIESGHANDTNQHYESLAWWYGRKL